MHLNALKITVDLGRVLCLCGSKFHFRLLKVSGYAVVDSQGLVLSAEGVAKGSNIALISTIAQLANKLEPGSGKPPVVSIESAKS